MADFDKEKALGILNKIMELELAGVVRYTHYSLMVYGYNRIPIVKWLRSQAIESLDHANRVGELITQFGGHPSLAIGSLLETHNHDIGDILRESLEHEQVGVKQYYALLEVSQSCCVTLEEYAREMIVSEEDHVGEVDKMIRAPGDIKSVHDSGMTLRRNAF